MIQRRAEFRIRAANDNRQPTRRAPSVVSKVIRFPRSRCERPLNGPLSPLIAGFAGLLLLALCSAFLLGLAAVGVLALAAVALQLLRYPWRNRAGRAVERQVVHFP